MKIEEIFSRLKPVAGEDLDVLWVEYILADSKARKEIEDSLRIALARELGQTFQEDEVLLEPPDADIARGEYPLGVVLYGREAFHPFGLREGEWIQHAGVFGRSGCGKTNLAFLVVLNFLARGKPFLVFDWKRNYRDLLSLDLGKEILVFTAGREVSPFYFNPLIPPPGTPATVWLKKLIEIMCHAYFLGEGVVYLLQKAIDSVYQEFGLYSGNASASPTMADVKDWLERRRTKGRESAWMDSAVRAVGVLCFGETGRILNQRQPFRLEELLEKNVILELDALTNSDKTFLIESLLLWIHHYRMGQEGREEFKHALIIEEAHHVLLRKKQEVWGEEAVTDIILREIRELGEAIVLIDQHPSLISKPALGNTYTTVCMNLKHRSDIAMIAESLLMDSEQAKYLGRIETGTGIVKLQGRWHQPFLVRFPLVGVKKGAVSDGMVKSLMSAWKGGPEVFREEGKFLGRDSGGNGAFRVPLAGGKGGQKGTGKGLAANEALLLRDVADARMSSVTERYMRLRLNAYQGSKARDSLLRKGLIEVKDVPVRTGRVKALELTPKGREAAEGLGLEAGPSFRTGGPEHSYWKRRIADGLRQKDWQVIEEYRIGGGRAVDLAAVKGRERMAIEIETGNSEAVYNVRKSMEAGFERIFCVALDGHLKKKIEEQLMALGIDRERVHVVLPEEILQ
jgi:DNA-binding MarR family transcriptional regulator